MHYNSKIKILTFFLGLLSAHLFSQVKIGNNPELIDGNSILELESNNKVLVITRLTQNQIDNLEPLSGALVYNIDAECIYAFDGLVWKNLCSQSQVSMGGSTPTNGNIGDFWFNASNNVLSIWDGNMWIPININPRRGIGAPDSTIISPLAGDIYVDQNTGDIYTYNGSNWIPLNQSIAADNGLSISNNVIQLGGDIITPTVLTTNTINTLAIQGLEDTSLDTSNKSVVTVDNTTGILQKVSSTSLIEQEQVVIIASNGQSQFTTPSLITNVGKIDVYRNGIRIDFSLVNNTTIEVEPEATCYAGDEIRIVQLK